MNGTRKRHRNGFLVASSLLFGRLGTAAAQPPKPAAAEIDQRTEKLLRGLTLDENIVFLGGVTFFRPLKYRIVVGSSSVHSRLEGKYVLENGAATQ
jgi:hypothetical protein